MTLVAGAVLPLLLDSSTYVLFEDAGEAGRCTRPDVVKRNIMEKSPKQEKVWSNGAPNLRQIQVGVLHRCITCAYITHHVRWARFLAKGSYSSYSYFLVPPTAVLHSVVVILQSEIS